MTLRFPLLAQPPAPPAHCVACRRPSDPIGFFDTGLELEWWGRVYLCATDLLEMVRSAMPQLGLAMAVNLDTERAARRGAERSLMAANAAAADARTALSSGALQLIHDVTMERLRLELAAAPEGEADDGTGPDAGAAGGDGPGGGRDDAGVPALEPERVPTGRRNGAAAGPPPRRRGSRPGPAAEPAAGGEAGPGADPAAADGDLTGTATGAGS